jgi:diacylglycerol kinase (ATP)
MLIHCAVTVLVVIAGLLFRISTTEWIAVLFAIGFVLAAEAINSVIERLSISRHYRQSVFLPLTHTMKSCMDV